MQRLLDPGQNQVRGLSFTTWPAALDPRPRLGFEWRLALTPATTAYRIHPDRTTISEVELDIVPVSMQRPLYTPYRR